MIHTIMVDNMSRLLLKAVINVVLILRTNGCFLFQDNACIALELILIKAQWVSSHERNGQNMGYSFAGFLVGFTRSVEICLKSSAPGRNRTCDTRIRNPVLYPLSYEGDWG